MDDRTVYERIASLETDREALSSLVEDLRWEVQCLREELGNYGGAPEGE